MTNQEFNNIKIGDLIERKCAGYWHFLAVALEDSSPTTKWVKAEVIKVFYDRDPDPDEYGETELMRTARQEMIKKV